MVDGDYQADEFNGETLTSLFNLSALKQTKWLSLIISKKVVAFEGKFFHLFKLKSCSFGEKQHSSTSNVISDIAVKNINFFNGISKKCNENKRAKISDETVKTKRLAGCFKDLGKATNCLEKKKPKIPALNLHFAVDVVAQQHQFLTILLQLPLILENLFIRGIVCN